MVNKSISLDYFGAINGGAGFVSYFREIFDPIGRVYVIKGGSGTGKSRLMRELDTRAIEKGYATERILCSSDPSSLDGIIIKELDTAVLDGTSPHVHEPTLIGVRESFIDLSAFLDGEALSWRRAEIEALITAKSERYARIYEYLRMVAKLEEMNYLEAKKCLSTAKLERAVEKSASMLAPSKAPEKKIRIRSAYSENGKITLDSYSLKAGKRFAVRDICGIGRLYLKKLLETSQRRGVSVQISYDTLLTDMPDALYFPDSGASFYIGNAEARDESVINTARFVDDMRLRAYKPEIRAVNRLKNDTEEMLRLEISAVRRLHGALEEIYSSAMRFDLKEKLTAELITRILK